ncbi:MAG TPA: aldolase, partial [Rhodobacteraceae bacterium]|nr:aldolase [Paracoccaceae bacterium]
MASVHASCVAIDGFGVLLRGPSGAGKTDLALRLMDDGSSRNPVTLVADDRVVLEAVEGQVRAWAPRRLRGFMEVA